MPTISEKIDPNRMSKQPFGLKAETTLQRITFTPSSANPGETLYINIPKLTGNNILVPGSVRLAFNLVVDGHANNTVVNNIGRNLVSNFKVVLGGETLQDTKRYDLFMTYHDLFLTTNDRNRRLKQGISKLNTRKLRTAAGDKDSSDAKEVALGEIYSNRYHIPINHPILDDHGVFNPRGIRETLSFEITLASISDIVVFSDVTKAPTFTLKNLELEYSCISSDYLASEALSAYASGKGFYYENILLHKTFEFSTNNDGVINEHINVPRRSMSGILCLFNEKITAGARNSEGFFYPDIQSVAITINGMPNKLYSKEMITTDFYDSMMKRMCATHDNEECDSWVVPEGFYAGGMFGLWIDLRTFPDDGIHGGGFSLDSTSDGVKLEIRRKVATSDVKITCYIYVVSDAIVEIMNSGLSSVKY